MRVRVHPEPFDYGAECEAFAQNVPQNSGAVVTFCGIVRDAVDAPIDRMEIEHYPAMTQRAIEAFVTQAMERWALSDAMVIHRYGTLQSGEMIMMVATAARHRVAAFEAAEFLMDYLKSRAPFWKKEITSDGATWVAAKDADEDALSRW